MKRARFLFGMMNHPARPLEKEIVLARRLGFDYVDLTLEPPEAGPEKFDVEKTRRWLAREKLGVVGHTSWTLQGNTSYPEVRRGIVESLLWAARHFASLGAKTMTYHIHGSAAKYIGLEAAIEAQVDLLRAASSASARLGVQVVVEHVTAGPDQFLILDTLFKKVPALGFHLDVGHANLSPDRSNLAKKFLARYGDRLRHVHFSDNRGRHDDHMPLGCGTIDWPAVTKELKRSGYRGTITLETFADDTDYVVMSLKKAKAWLA